MGETVTDIPDKLPVKGPDDLFLPTPKEVLHAKPVEGITDSPEVDKLDVSLSFWERLVLFFDKIAVVAEKTGQAISDIQSIISGIKWVALILVICGIGFALLRAFHVL
jgi:hypothetical protein